MRAQADIGVIGLAVMGENLILNMEDKGFTVACYNRTVEKVDAFVQGRGQGKKLIGCRSLEELVASLIRPRRVMIMVRAGKAVDMLIKALIPLLEHGDVIVDGGNSSYLDSTRRCRELAEKGLRYVGAGVSGGEEGALHGPSIMPGGNDAAWPALQPIFQAIAAKARDGAPCCEWIGPEGSGHFVKMVHNGIEYGDMQLICEAYHILAQGLGLGAKDIQSIFARWNTGPLDSYLVEITADILGHKDPDTGQPLLDVILDAAGQKGTGKWTSQVGLDLGVAVPQIAEAVFARCLSAVKDERMTANGLLKGPGGRYAGDSREFVQQLEKAVYAAKICSYAQGFQLMRAASLEYDWNLKYGEIAMIWREGCIIRARFLGTIKDAYGEANNAGEELANLVLAPYFRDVLANAQSAWRSVLTTAMNLGIPMPVMASALHYYDGYRCQRLPANLLQAQRDYFGAHTYERVDRPRGEFFHTNWTGEGGTTSSSTYSV